jgi:hypothetical protein
MSFHALVAAVLVSVASSQSCSVRFLNELEISGAHPTAQLSYASGAVIDTQPSPGLGGYTAVPCDNTSAVVNWPGAAVRFFASPARRRVQRL